LNRFVIISGIYGSIFCTNIAEEQQEFVVKSVQVKDIWPCPEESGATADNDIPKRAEQVLALLGTSLDRYREHNADLINLAQEQGISLEIFLADLIEVAKNLYVGVTTTDSIEK